jgi:predicted membrane-bound spermidine synthase
MTRKRLYTILFIFTVSGFSGLIYESIWTHYLKLFLGHAAYAQTLVLAIFMGGMALGSWICSRYSVRWKNLLIGYALAEGVIGLFALFFHTLFDQAVQISYAAIIPLFDSAAAANGYKWTLSALMILPQSILLGMTFPLMSAGVIRSTPQKAGRILALLYFTNSMGAAIGVLASGFLLIRFLGLPWTIRLAGLINIAIALSIWLLARKQAGEPLRTGVPSGKMAKTAVGRYRLFLFASFVTGAASFIYEIGWIRMLNLVLGSSTHAFELMLSAFILGLALGGLWIHNRIDGVAVPARMLAWVQIAMGGFALLTLPLYGYTFDVMRWLVNTLARTEQGYLLFNLFSSGIAMAIMLPATFCAGMTLPLITYSLIKEGCGERSIGAVYAANTVGAIIGIFFAIHLGFPLFGLKNLITFGAACDIALGLLLFWVAAGYASKRRPLMVSAVGICAVAVALLFFRLDPYKMTSDVYRTGELLSAAEIEFKYYRDGKTATISTFLEKETGVLAINTNGKTDASINMTPGRRPAGDEPTMILAAVLPMAFHPQAGTAANIGLGSGLTTQTLLGNPQLKRVDTVEIEESVVEAAKGFRPRVDLVYTDPRSTVFIEDAKSFFSVHGKKYDIIVSEPSNPWVSGVAGLFSREFYALLNRHLTEEGLFVQWIQLYEVDNDIVLSVLKAISDHFSDFVAYAAHDRDMLIVAKKKGKLSEPDPQIFKIPAISAALERVFIKGMQDIAVRKLGNKASLKRLLETSPVRANSDYHPFVDQSAGRTRFLRANAYDFHNLSQTLLPSLEMLQGDEPSWIATEVSFPSFYFKSQSAYKAMALRDYGLNGSFGSKYGRVPPAIDIQAKEFRKIFQDCRTESEPIDRFEILYRTATDLIPYLRPQELASLWEKLESGNCARLFSPEEKNWMALFKAVGGRDAGAMADGAKSILQSGKRIKPEALRFLVASGMAGSLMRGDREGSLRFWSDYRSILFGTGQPDLFFRMLAAESAKPESSW